VGRLYASCGHEVQSAEDLVFVEFDEDGEGVGARISGAYCTACVEVLGEEEREPERLTA